MCNRKNTILCSFANDNPRRTACNINEWVYNTLNLQEEEEDDEEIDMVQVEGLNRQVF
jgi:hypothetical protein